MDERYRFEYQLRLLWNRWLAEDIEQVQMFSDLLDEMDRPNPLMDLFARLPED